MTIPAHGAIVRGDDYQYAIGLYRAAQLLTDPSYVSVSVEDKAGGAFDDIVLRSTASSGRPIECDQVKSGNFNVAVIDGEWMLRKGSEGGRSPLQHFHDTWAGFKATGEAVILRLVTNKNFDHNNPLFKLISKTTEGIARSTLDGLGPRTNGGKQLAEWAKHLGVELDELKDFLTDVQFVRGGSESFWRQTAGALLKNGGFRGDAEAVSLGVEMVREWVKEGAGERTRADVRRELVERNLLLREGELVLAIHGIHRAEVPQAPNATVDVVDLYDGDDPFNRRLLKNADDWMAEVLPAIKAAKKDLEGFGTKRLHLEANMRLSMYFAVGRTFPGVGNWVLSSDQRGVNWSTSVDREDAGDAVVLARRDIGCGGDLAVSVGLTFDPTDDVLGFISKANLSVHSLITLSAASGPGEKSVPSPGWAADWVRKAREVVRREVRDVGAERVHLYMAAPAGVALFLGHDWNQVPETTVYDHIRDGTYAPTMRFAG